MQPKTLNKYLLSLAIASALTTTGVSAATANYSVGFTTVPDIGITEVTAMDFGASLALTSGAICSMAIEDSSTAGYPGDVTMKLAGAGSDLAEGTSGDIGGAGCAAAAAGAKGTIGIYEVQGIAGGAVKVTVNPVAGGADFDYDAIGCVGNYDGATAGDTCDDILSDGNAVSVKIASPGDTVGNAAAEGIPTPGKLFIALGGTITTTTTHTSGQSLQETFTIDVTY